MAVVAAFPVCRLPQPTGLTHFKVVSEYVISGILLAALGFLCLRRRHLDKAVFAYMTAAFIATTGSEIVFTSYANVKDVSNLAGHLLKVIAVFLTYRALVAAGLRRPFEVLFRGLADSEANIRRQKDLLAVTLASIGDAVIVTDTPGRVTFLNGEAERLTGWTLDQAAGQPLAAIFQIVNEETRQAVESPVDKALRLGTVVGLANHTILIAKDGRETPIDDSAAPVRSADGTVHGVVLVFRDITERKQAEDALRTSEAKYRNLFENMAEEVHFWQIVRDQAGQITTWRLVDANPPTLKTWGRTLEEIRGRTTDEIFGPGAAEHFRGVVCKIMAEGVPHSFEDYFPHLDRHFRFTSVPLGEYFITTGADITGIKKAQETLRESELFYRQTLESIPGMVFTTRPDGYCDYQSQQWVDYTGVPMSEHLGNGWNQLLHPDDRPLAYAAWRDAVEGRAPYDLEYRVRRHDGQYEWFKVIGQPIRDGAGQIVRWFGVAANIHEMKRAEQQLKELNETLEKRVAERTAEAEQRAEQLRALAAQLTQAEQKERQRLATILHDHLQQLLVGAKFSVGILRAQLGNPKQLESLRQVDDVLDESLDASRSLTIDLSPPILQQGTMPQVLQWLGQWFRSKHGLAVEVQANEAANAQSQEVRVLLFQAVRELLFNVVKHAKTDQAKVELSCTSGGRVKVVVSDLGVGFDPAQPRNDKNAGSGFGLFSIRERLAWLGGTLQIESESGSGTRASIVAPMRLKTAEAELPAAIEIVVPVGQAPSITRSGSGPKVG